MTWVLWQRRTRNTPIGVVLREPPAVNHLVVHIIHFLVREMREIATNRAAKVVSSDSPPSICFIALQSSEYLKPPSCRERFSIFVGVCTQNWGLGALRGAKVIPSNSPPSICYFALESSEYLKPFSSYFVASFRDIHTYGRTYIHTRNLDSIMAILR